jgi:hypothetical protein
MLSDTRISKSFLVFLFAWVIVNILQSDFTDLNNDEAYYWMYSQYPAWGYFDHPPMIAMMIRAGYFLIHNELGVRIIGVLFSAASLLMIWTLIPESEQKKRNLPYYIMLAVILPVFNIYGFIATPDSPLIFFSVLFLFVYKRFSEKATLANTLLMGLVMAAMMYSKYHAALFIIFVILSDLSLLRKPWFYIASFLGVLLFVPHIYWQFSNGFPSFKYHLVERVSGLHAENIPEYIGNLFVFQNPVILILGIWLTFKRKTSDAFERTLKFIFYGFMIFFLLSSLRYRVQPQWTSLMSVPLIIIVFNSVDFSAIVTKMIRWTAYIMVPLIVIARLALVFDFLPVKFLREEYHDYSKKMKELSAIAGDKPVVFTNSYQDPSVYTFYTGKFSHSLNNVNYRKTQFDIWNFEDSIHGKEVLYAPHWPTPYIMNNFRKYRYFNGDTVYIKEYRDFRSVQKEIVHLDSTHYTFSKTAVNNISVKIFNPYHYVIDIKHPDFPVVFYLTFFNRGVKEERYTLQLPETTSTLVPGDTVSVNLSFLPSNLKETEYIVAVCCETGPEYDPVNSNFSTATVK